MKNANYYMEKAEESLKSAEGQTVNPEWAKFYVMQAIAYAYMASVAQGNPIDINLIS